MLPLSFRGPLPGPPQGERARAGLRDHTGPRPPFPRFSAFFPLPPAGASRKETFGENHVQLFPRAGHPHLPHRHRGLVPAGTGRYRHLPVHRRPAPVPACEPAGLFAGRPLVPHGRSRPVRHFPVAGGFRGRHRALLAAGRAPGRHDGRVPGRDRPALRPPRHQALRGTAGGPAFGGAGLSGHGGAGAHPPGRAGRRHGPQPAQCLAGAGHHEPAHHLLRLRGRPARRAPLPGRHPLGDHRARGGACGPVRHRHGHHAGHVPRHGRDHGGAHGGRRRGHAAPVPAGPRAAHARLHRRRNG